MAVKVERRDCKLCYLLLMYVPIFDDDGLGRETGLQAVLFIITVCPNFR